MITTRNIDVLLKGVRAEFALVVDQASKQLQMYNSNVFLDAVNKTGGLFEEIGAQGRQRWEAISVTGTQLLSPTVEAQEFIQKDYTPSFITTVEPFKFTGRLKVTREAAERRDSMYLAALNEATKLNVASENTKAKHRFDRLNKAFALVTQPEFFDYGDGVPLVSASHPNKVGGVASNSVAASDLSPSSIEAMVLTLQNQKDDQGIPMPAGGGMKYLVVPPAKVRKAKENIDSEWIVDSANNNINVWKSQGWNLVTSPWLSASNGGSDTAWFIVDANDSPLKDVMFRPITNETWFDENTKVFVHDISMEHKVGPVNYRSLVGNLGA